MTRAFSLFVASAAILVSAAACACHPERDASRYRRADEAGVTRDDYGRPDAAVDVSRVSDAGMTAHPGRIYVTEPSDPNHVYWYESASPATWYYRPYYRSGDRAYFIERDGSSVQRIWFDADSARDPSRRLESRWSADERARILARARDDWKRQEPGERNWRRNWDDAHPAECL